MNKSTREQGLHVLRLLGVIVLNEELIFFLSSVIAVLSHVDWHHYFAFQHFLACDTFFIISESGKELTVASVQGH